MSTSTGGEPGGKATTPTLRRAPAPAPPDAPASGTGRIPRLSVEAARAETATPKPPAPDALDRNLKLLIVGGAVVILIGTVLLGSIPTQIVMAVICLGVLQGLWRGASELVGLVVSSLIALLLAPPLGRALEGVVSSLAGTAGILNRMISIGLVWLAVVMVGTVAVSVAAKAILRRHPSWRRWNSVAGAGLGLLEGTILGMALLWTGLALEPVAASQINDTTGTRQFAPGEEGPSPIAKGMKAFADNVRASALGSVAQATNPIEGSRLLSLANDFVAVSRDDAAMEFFLTTPAMQEIQALPSVIEARQMIAADASLKKLLEEKGVSTDTLRAVMESPTLLAVLDRTTVVSDLTPRANDLVAALAEAKFRIGSPHGQKPPR